MYLSNNCSWHEHIDYITATAWQRINAMRCLQFDLDRKSLQILYFSFIRPLLEYADIVWNNCTKYESLGLEQIQYEAARIDTAATRLVSINSLLTETGLETLSSRRKNHKLVMFTKCKITCVLFTYPHSCLELLDHQSAIIYAIQVIFKLSILILSCITLLVYRLL